MIHAYYVIPNNLYVLFTSKLKKTNWWVLLYGAFPLDELVEEMEYSLFTIPVFVKKEIFQSAEIKSYP